MKINHVIFAIDCSGSMDKRMSKVNMLFKSLLARLSASQNKDIFTIVSVYSISSSVGRHLYRIPLEQASLKAPNFVAGGATVLKDCLIQITAENLPFSDTESAIVYVLTDGQDYMSVTPTSLVEKKLNSLPDSWTIACLVPDNHCRHAAKSFGIPAGNIDLWNVDSSHGVEEMTETIFNAHANYTTLRASGAVGTRNLFAPDASKITSRSAQTKLVPVDGMIFTVDKTSDITSFVKEATGKDLVRGKAFYELTKKEKLQPQKEIVIVNSSTKQRLGGAQARAMLGLPAYDCRVEPGSHGDWSIFIQSTSSNRKLIEGQKVLIRP